MSVTTRSKTQMPEIPQTPENDAVELSIDEKLDKIIASAGVMTQLKTDIDTMTVSVKGLTDDLNKLNKITDAIPNIRTQLKKIQDDISVLKNDSVTTKRQLTETNKRLKELEKENIWIQTKGTISTVTGCQSNKTQHAQTYG